MSHLYYSPRRVFAIVLLIATLTSGLQNSAHAATHTRVAAQTIRPQAYLVIFDASTSMSWNFAGQGSKHGRDIQCGLPLDPNVRRQACGAGAPWRIKSERRIYATKQGIRRVIDQMYTFDTMRLLAFSTKGISTNQRWTANKRRLRQDLLSLGSYLHEPYRTAGEAPSASALFRARQLLAEMPQTAPNGVPYGSPVVIFITDSVANRFLKANGGWEHRPDDTCPNVPFADEIATCQTGYTSSDPPLPKPITAMLLQADQLKPNATVYVIALAHVDETGLKSVASVPAYPYFSTVQSAGELAGVLDSIVVRIIVYP
ncbi:MAG TPA: hypothetical protein VFO07_09020 [Roseiflexaceae bacterium]|nr:hypothetical protein [Roseiflexaceae bacterium]